MSSILVKTDDMSTIGHVRSWLDWNEIECAVFQVMEPSGKYTWKFVFPEEATLAFKEASMMFTHEHVQFTSNLEEHLSPFHDTVSDVPFDGINGCEKPHD